MTFIFLLFLILILLGSILLVAFLWIKQRRYLKKKASEAMSEEVWQEVVQEREAALEKRRKFREVLEKTKQAK